MKSARITDVDKVKGPGRGPEGAGICVEAKKL